MFLSNNAGFHEAHSAAQSHICVTASNAGSLYQGHAVAWPKQAICPFLKDVQHSIANPIGFDKQRGFPVDRSIGRPA